MRRGRADEAVARAEEPKQIAELEANRLLQQIGLVEPHTTFDALQPGLLSQVRRADVGADPLEPDHLGMEEVAGEPQVPADRVFQELVHYPWCGKVSVRDGEQRERDLRFECELGERFDPPRVCHRCPDAQQLFRIDRVDDVAEILPVGGIRYKVHWFSPA